jgi:hypothetical protein
VKRRGFISLEMALIAAAVVAVGVVVWWLSGLRVAKLEAEYEAFNAKERAARAEVISGLALKLSDVQLKSAAERVQHETALLDAQREREKHLHELVPQNAATAVCISRGFVQYTNAAAAGVPLGVQPGPGVVQAPAGVGTDTVAAVTGRNYAKYHGCKDKVEGILKEFDTKRTEQNSVIDRINQRVQRAERKVQ